MGRHGHMATILVLGLLLGAGCNPEASLFSDTFRSYVRGDVVPLTPGEASGLVLVRLVNDTAYTVDFVVTAERQVLVTDDEGNAVIESTDETVRLRTFPFETGNEIGALFDCPVSRIGLGHEIDQIYNPDGLYVITGEAGTGVEQGFGVPSRMNPLDSRAGNFGCGDTLVIRAIESQGEVGNLELQPFVLPWMEQPTEFVGPHTFNNVRLFLEQQVPEE